MQIVDNLLGKPHAGGRPIHESTVDNGAHSALLGAGIQVPDGSARAALIGVAGVDEEVLGDVRPVAARLVGRHVGSRVARIVDAGRRPLRRHSKIQLANGVAEGSVEGNQAVVSFRRRAIVQQLFCYTHSRGGEGSERPSAALQRGRERPPPGIPSGTSQEGVDQAMAGSDDVAAAHSKACTQKGKRRHKERRAVVLVLL